jgi:hypothetical protein
VQHARQFDSHTAFCEACICLKKDDLTLFKPPLILEREIYEKHSTFICVNALDVGIYSITRVFGNNRSHSRVIHGRTNWFLKNHDFFKTRKVQSLVFICLLQFYFYRKMIIIKYNCINLWLFVPKILLLSN